MALQLYAGITFAATLVLRLFTTIFLAAIILFIATATYRLTAHPLASIPGPKLAAVSSFWHAYQARNGRMAHLGRTLHRRYGPIVRFGPNEVWFNTKEAFQAIYSKIPNSYDDLMTPLIASSHGQRLPKVRLLL